MKIKLFALVLCLAIASLCLFSCAGEEKKTEPEVTEAQITEEVVPNVDPADYYGCWKYTSCNEWICIFEDGNYMIHAGMEELISPTPFEATPEGIYIALMDMTLYYNEEGVLCSDDGFTFEKSELAAYDLYLEYNMN